MRIRTGYSFKHAVGHVDEVADRIKEIGWRDAPISDRLSTFGYVSWTKACEERGLRPVYGVELPVAAEPGVKRTPVDHWSFFAVDHLRPLNEAVERATAKGGLSYGEAEAWPGLIKITGERCLLDRLSKRRKNVYVPLAPSTPAGLLRAAAASRIPLCLSSDNVYTREDDREFYRVALGLRASTQTYPQHVMSDDEIGRWLPDSLSPLLGPAAKNRDAILKRCRATLGRAELLHPPAELSLLQLCEQGAAALGVDLGDPVYRERLDRELRLIAEKKFEDYFHIISDLMRWSRERMVVGPARGSSCGSLVCYLLGITSIDPIPYRLIFERFIDTTRSDLPDIDLDFSDRHRHLAIEYLTKKYGAEHTARLGSVVMWQAKSALNTVGVALRIPRWQVNEVSNTVAKRSFGDSRADSTVIDTLQGTEVGRRMLEQFPAAIIADRMEDHPASAGKHAAGVLITDSPVVEYVAIDSRSGTAMCDKYDAERFNLLKIDMLGLTQLSVFERCLELIGEEPRNGFLDRIPLDDQAAFDVLNSGRYSGIFQFQQPPLQNLMTRLVRVERGRVDHIEDIVTLGAIVRPGPLGSGAADHWLRRKAGSEPVDYVHPLLEKHLAETYGIIIYQEQIMHIGKEIGGLTWEDVTALRKAMSKSLGKEYFDQFGDRWKRGAYERLTGMSKESIDQFWADMCQFGMWCLSGDTVLENPHPNQHAGRRITLRDLYLAGGTFNEQKGGLQKLYCLTGERCHPTRMVSVSRSGVKETWLVKTECGRSIRATLDHRFLCSDGKYRRLRDISPGDHVVMMKDFDPEERDKRQGRGTYLSRVESITDRRMEDVYDISMPAPHHNFVAEGFVVHNCFNRSHSVAYGMVTYWCCWLKAHHPVEFAAATMDAEDPERQVAMLREMREEGIEYVPIDKDHSTDRWGIKVEKGRRVLVGPLSNIRGVGPMTVRDIMDARRNGTELRPALLKRLTNATTEVDSLSPIYDAIRRNHPDLSAIGIVSTPTPIKQVEGRDQEVMIFGRVSKVMPLNENEPSRIARRRGKVLTGPTTALNLFLEDDTAEMFCKIDRFLFQRIGREVVSQAKKGKSLFAVKGVCPSDFRMIRINKIRYLGEF